jgi:threonine synthase
MLTTGAKEALLVCPLHPDTVAASRTGWSCDLCGSTLRVAYDTANIHLDAETLRGRPHNLFRLAELLPVRQDPVVGVHTGWSPLLPAPRLGSALGLEQLYLKLDCYNFPSYSYKDRVVAMAIQRAAEDGLTAIGCASTGNVGNSVAAIAAACGMRAVVFYPAGLEPAKTRMTLAHGAEVIEVDGSYDDTNALCRALALDGALAFVNLTLRPYYAEGAKTMAFEIAEQLGWRPPDHVIVPAAGAALLTRLAQGFVDLCDVGLTTGARPRLHAAQAAACSPIVHRWAGTPASAVPDPGPTIARSLAIGRPADADAAVDCIRRGSGSAVAVTDPDMVAGIDLLASSEGVYTEPAGGAVIAALRQLAAAGTVRSDEVVVAAITGSGLKAGPEVGADPPGRCHHLAPDLSLVRATLDRVLSSSPL